jgi:hypothetical protein
MNDSAYSCCAARAARRVMSGSSSDRDSLCARVGIRVLLTALVACGYTVEAWGHRPSATKFLSRESPWGKEYVMAGEQLGSAVDKKMVGHELNVASTCLSETAFKLFSAAEDCPSHKFVLTHLERLAEALNDEVVRIAQEIGS